MDLPVEKRMESLPRFIAYHGTEPEPTLPLELEHEPFSFIGYSDGLEARVRRHKFTFQIYNSGVPACMIGNTTMRSRLRPAEGARDLYMSGQSMVSVLTVYDNYGLDVAYTYMKHLYETRYLELAPEWLLVYLLGSLAHMGVWDWKMEDTSPYRVLGIYSEIMRALVALDSREPRLTEELSSVAEDTLPPELLARIVRSVHISKDIATEVQTMRCSTPPTYEELSEANGWIDGVTDLVSN